MFAHAFSSIPRNCGEPFGIRGSLQQRVRKRVVVALVHQNSTSTVLDRFRNSAVLGGENRQAAGHRLEHGIWNAFLVAVSAYFAGMKENVRLIKKVAQLRLRNEAGKENLVGDSQLSRELPELVPQRTFPRNRERGSWMAFRELRERTQTHAQPFLLNKPARLDGFPRAIHWPFARTKRNLVHRNPGVLQPDLSRGTPEIDERAA